MSIPPSKSPPNNPYYPIFVDISGKLCIVVGGGAIAERKARSLLKFGALVTVISPFMTKGLKALAVRGRISALNRPYEEGDLRGAALVFAATNNDATNRAVRDEAALTSIPVNVVDDPRLCDFIVPSLVQKGPITIAISTSGTLPMLSKKLRRELEGLITKDHLDFLSIVSTFRQYLICTINDKTQRSVIMKQIAALPMEEVARMTFTDLKKRFLP